MGGAACAWHPPTSLALSLTQTLGTGVCAQEKVLTQKEREEEEMGNAMKALENRTLESKREMDIMAALDEMRTLNSRHSKVRAAAAAAAGCTRPAW